MASSRKHLLLITAPAYGHIIPLLELAEKITHHHDVTFGVSEFKLEEVRRHGLLSKYRSINFYGIPDGYFEAENEKDQSQTIFINIMNFVIPGVEKIFRTVTHSSTSRSAVSGPISPVDLVISDNMLSPVLPVLKERSIPFYFFNTASAATMQVIMAVNDDTPTLPETSQTQDLPFLEIPQPGAAIALPFKQMLLPMHKAALLSDGIVENSAYELETKSIDTIRSHPDFKNVPFLCIGPLVSLEQTKDSKVQGDIKEWLDRRPHQSVVFISFGSVAAQHPGNIQAIVESLISLGKPFIWSLRKQYYEHLPSEISSKIENQFSNDCNFLILDWMPQKLILQHKSTAVFVSHCGWNSTTESVASGVPVVAWPMFGDQMINALDLVDKGVGVLIEGTGVSSKNVISPTVIRESISRAAGFDLAGKNCQGPWRNAAVEWKKKMEDAVSDNGCSHKDFEQLITLPIRH